MTGYSLVSMFTSDAKEVKKEKLSDYGHSIKYWFIRASNWSPYSPYSSFLSHGTSLTHLKYAYEIMFYIRVIERTS